MSAIFNFEKITTENISKLKDLYNDCQSRSFKDYNFELELLDFNGFVENIKYGILQGFLVSVENQPKAFMIYTESINPAIEINIIHCSENPIVLKDFLIKSFLEYLSKNDVKKTISYPMMGVQGDFVTKISDYGFKFVNQCVFRFKFNDQESVKVFNDFSIKTIEKDFEVKNWHDNHLNDVAELVFKEFSKAQDSKYDERFLSLEGTKSIVKNITTDGYGEFLPKVTKILLYKNKCIGVCLVNLTVDTMANVPLIAIDSAYKNKGLGLYLLKSAMDSLFDELSNKTLKINEINATTDKDNIAAVAMYQKLGFKIDFEYKHAYLKL